MSIGIKLLLKAQFMDAWICRILQLFYQNIILILSEERNLKRILHKTKIEISIKELKICWIFHALLKLCKFCAEPISFVFVLFSHYMIFKFFFIDYGPVVYNFITKTIDDTYVLLSIWDRIDKLFAFFQRASHNKYYVEEFTDTGELCFLFISTPCSFCGFWSIRKYKLLIESKSIIFGNFQAMYQVSVLLVLNFRGRSILGLNHDNNVHAIKVKNTLIFNAFVLCQVSLHDLSMGKYR